MIRKTKNGFQVDISLGRTKRHRKAFKTRQEAQAYERHFLAKLENGKEWQPTNDKRHLTDLVIAWYELHGKNLRDGLNRVGILNKLCDELDNPVGRLFSANDFAKYRAKNPNGYKPKTLNNRQTYLSSVFNELRRLKEIDYPNPLSELRTIKLVERELSYLSDDDINNLLEAVKPNKSLYDATLICLTCGTRWGEATRLQPHDLKGGKISIFGKNGKYRHIPIRKEIADIIELPIQSATKNAFNRAYVKSGVRKTEGQLTHILRHTFASHFIMNGGDILSLQKILDHSTLTMTMRYAHLSPDYLNETLKYAPVVNLSSS